MSIIITYIILISLILAIFLISYREIKKSISLEGTLHSDLEKITSRIDRAELKSKRQDHMVELSKKVEFGNLSQGIVHDLISPLTSIILKEGGSSKAHADLYAYIDTVRTTLSRDNANETFNISDILQKTLHLLTYRIRHEQVTIEVDEEEILWYGNSLKLQQIFLNLITNSIDSLEGRSIKKIFIQMHRKDNDVCIYVQDTGNGINQNIIDKIYTTYFTTKTREKGSGIGLSTVKSIVERELNGNISVESVVGVGSTFIVRFPLTKTQTITL